jgi:hypothetical protein
VSAQIRCDDVKPRSTPPFREKLEPLAVRGDPVHADQWRCRRIAPLVNVQSHSRELLMIGDSHG